MNEKILNIWNDPRRTPTLIGVVAFGAGTGLGYFLGLKKRVKLEVVSDDVTVSYNVSDFNEQEYLKLVKAHPVSIPKAVEGQAFIINEFNQARPEVKEDVVDEADTEDDPELVKRSIFASSDNWDYDEELAKRNPDQPYVLHKDEFYGEELGYTQSTLTFYAGDQILVDEDDAPIYNHEQITGQLLFGHGSKDPNVVHIRNDKRKAEYEVLFDPGLYSVEVLGLEIENNQRVKDLQHSRNRKFREE